MMREDYEVLIATLRRRSTEPGMGWLNLAADALSSRDTVAVEDVEKIADWLERDRREPDKILCHILSLRRLAEFSRPSTDDPA